MISLIADGDASPIPEPESIWEEDIGDLYGG
jgi:hypothetical protein